MNRRENIEHRAPTSGETVTAPSRIGSVNGQCRSCESGGAVRANLTAEGVGLEPDQLRKTLYRVGHRSFAIGLKSGPSRNGMFFILPQTLRDWRMGI
jgi:hypothetical protein